MDELNGKVAVVTGGASGIGGAVASALAAESMKVVVAFSETLQQEMLEGGTGVGVTCLCPGFVATNIINSKRNRYERSSNRVRTWAAMSGTIWMARGLETPVLRSLNCMRRSWSRPRSQIRCSRPSERSSSGSSPMIWPTA